jgi:anaerobic selenocysteine-containing dehydrogenase
MAAMLIQNTNPAMVAPESAAVRRGFLRDDLFVCVHEQFMTDTARLADMVLPATMFAEHDDIYQPSGHTFLQVAKAAAPAPGECRSNHEFIGLLAKRLGVDHLAFAMDIGALIDRLLSDSGKPRSVEWPDRIWLDCALPFEKAHFLDGFGHADGRFRFAPDWSAVGPAHAVMPAFPDHLPVIEEVSEDFPFHLVPAPARHFLNSTFSETQSSRASQGSRPTVLVHPQTAATLGIAESQLVRLGNRRGSVRLHAHLFDGVQPTTLVVESQWAHECFVDGIGINVLVGAEPGYPNGGAAYHDTAVWLRLEPL